MTEFKDYANNYEQIKLRLEELKRLLKQSERVLFDYKKEINNI